MVMTIHILSQIFAGMALLLVAVSYQLKSKSKLLIFYVLANVAYCCSYLLLYDLMGFTIMGIAALRMFAFFLLEKYNPKQWVSVSTLLFFIVAHSVSSILTCTNWFDFVLMFAVCLFTFGAWNKGEHLVRITNIIYSLLLIVHNIMVANWIGIAVESCVITSILIYYIRRYIKTKKELSQENI